RNTGQSKGVPGLDLNVVEAWSRGYTGKGVTTAIMDDGTYSAYPATNISLFIVQSLPGNTPRLSHESYRTASDTRTAVKNMVQTLSSH
ncbi:hypothetical protein BaRGS_00003945, partial [Batillaria attramentaria]